MLARGVDRGGRSLVGAGTGITVCSMVLRRGENRMLRVSEWVQQRVGEELHKDLEGLYVPAP